MCLQKYEMFAPNGRRPLMSNPWDVSFLSNLEFILTILSSEIDRNCIAAQSHLVGLMVINSDWYLTIRRAYGGPRKPAHLYD